MTLSNASPEFAPRWLWLLLPATAMSLGWGLRGFIGGGEMGAMIPGALVALALCLLLRRDDPADVAIIAALGAVGVAFGGQMTYGQTIGLSLDPSTRWWGLLGLALKGGIWGLLGGAVIGMALERRSGPSNFQRPAIALAVLVGLAYAGWWFINHPKLIYFSNPIDRPREEMWAGLLAGALGMLFFLRSHVSWRFAVRAAIGGWFGFGIGGWLQVMGHDYAPTPWIGYWKVMELFFGFLFGLSLGHAAWTMRDRLQSSGAFNNDEPGIAVDLAAGLAAVGFAIAIGVLEWQEFLGRVGFTAIGAVWIAIALRSTVAAWHMAITITIAAFLADFVKRYQFDGFAAFAGVAVLSLAVAVPAIRSRHALSVFLLLLWTSTLDSYAKSWYRGFTWDGHAIVEIAFTLLGLAATWMALRTRA